MFKNKEKAHLYISFVKSLLRIIAAFTLIAEYFEVSGLLFLAAEMAGVWEELVVQ